MVYESDSKPYIWDSDIDETEKLVRKSRIIRRDFAILKPDTIVPYPNLFSYNACRMLTELPESIRMQLGHPDFLSMVKGHYKGLCQHAVSHTELTCPSCIKMNHFLEQPRPFSAPINEHHHPAFKDGLYYKNEVHPKAKWHSITNAWGKVQKQEIEKIKQQMKDLRTCNFARIKSGLESYFE